MTSSMRVVLTRLKNAFYYSCFSCCSLTIISTLFLGYLLQSIIYAMLTPWLEFEVSFCLILSKKWLNPLIQHNYTHSRETHLVWSIYTKYEGQRHHFVSYPSQKSHVSTTQSVCAGSVWLRAGTWRLKALELVFYGTNKASCIRKCSHSKPHTEHSTSSQIGTKWRLACTNATRHERPHRTWLLRK